MEDYNNGWKSGEILAGMTGGEGTAIILDAPAVQKPAARMGNGFEDYIDQKTNIKLIEPPIGIDNWSAENAQTAMRDMLGKYGPGEITMVFCANDDIAVGAMNAIDQAGRTGDILLWGFMGYPAGLEGVKSGRMTGTMFSDVYVQYSMLFYIMMYNISTGTTSYTAGYTETPYIEMPMFPVTADNVDEIMITSRWFT
jgi:ribose transport system substrate-binding protein